MLEFFFTACEHEQGLSFLPPRISYSRAHMLQNSISVCCAEMQLRVVGGRAPLGG